MPLITTGHKAPPNAPKCLLCRTGGLFLLSNLAKPLGTNRVRALLRESFQHLTIVLDFGVPPYPICHFATGSPASQRPAFSALAKNGTPIESFALAFSVTQPAVDSDLSLGQRYHHSKWCLGNSLSTFHLKLFTQSTVGLLLSTDLLTNEYLV